MDKLSLKLSDKKPRYFNTVDVKVFAIVINVKKKIILQKNVIFFFLVFLYKLKIYMLVMNYDIIKYVIFITNSKNQGDSK